ncbi:universal stress protein [Massilia sp. GCM10023247]|uniref:universal stress protein n=1 Tax=Massilia sp. GCM10023247 TaxID=3252643 RepID=UPI00360F5901
MFRRILIATDGSWLAESAARAAISLAKGGKAEVLAFSAAPPYPVRLTGRETKADIEAAMAEAHQEAIAHVATVAGLAHEAGVACRTVTAISPFPGDEIIHVAEENACDLIVLGASGGRIVPPGLAGGVAQQVLAYSPVPVLMLRDAGRPEHTL